MEGKKVQIYQYRVEGLWPGREQAVSDAVYPIRHVHEVKIEGKYVLVSSPEGPCADPKAVKAALERAGFTVPGYDRGSEFDFYGR